MPNPWLQLAWTTRFLLRAAMRGELNRTTTSFATWRKFWRDFSALSQRSPNGLRPRWKHPYPCLGDDSAETPIEPIYYYQDAWAFARIVQHRPLSHVDVGSHHKYVALLSRVVPVTMVDIRPPQLPLEGLCFRRGSITDLPFEDGTVPSVSSLCVVEHIGLGRYGDPIDPRGSEKAIAELKRIVAPGGYLYLSVPIHDENRIYFNAHRAFQESYLFSLFVPFEITDRRYIFGNDFLATPRSGFGVGCYELRRGAS